MDENDQEMKSPMKRMGSTRKILVFNNIRQQLNEQLRCLDMRVESQTSLVQDLQDFFRRRGELELDYSKSLDKYARSLLQKHKEQRQKREQLPIYSTYSCWQQLVNQTQALSRDHATLSDLYSIHIVSILQTTIEDIQRIYKKCRGIGYEIHEDILRVLQELHTTMKTYQRYESECKIAEMKLVTAETHKAKLLETTAKEKLERSKKYKLTEKEITKRKTKYTDSRLKALRAKNEYKLCLEAANTTIHKYFVEDLSDLIDCMDLGFGSMVARAILMHVCADQGRSRSILNQADGLSCLIHSIDNRADKQKFLEQHHAAFMIPKRLEFQGIAQDSNVEPDIQKALCLDIEQRLDIIERRISCLRTESDEIWKTLETAEIKLLEHLHKKDYDTSELFTEKKQLPTKSFNTSTKFKAEKQEIEEFYISKIRDYLKGTSRIARLDAKADILRNILINEDFKIISRTKPIVSKRKRIGRVNICTQPKLFGGSLEEYLESTGEQIPLIMRSCIRVINLYGLHHQGIFRVSGSQVEIVNFREIFEKGEDPLAETTDASDINSVAGVLKLYLRELREPLFPIMYFEQFISITEMRTKNEIISSIRKFLHCLPPSILIIIRYLFAFLNHLSEYADENMMDAYNLAICFGPTLMPAPDDKDQVQYQNQVNEIIKYMIIYHEDLFPKDLIGPEYEKYITQDNFIDIEISDSPSEVYVEDPEPEMYPSEDEPDILEAIVQFDFTARSNRELSLKKGDTVFLKKQVSSDWWLGTSNDKDGLIPDKYVSLKIKDEDRDRSIFQQINFSFNSSQYEEMARKQQAQIIKNIQELNISEDRIQKLECRNEETEDAIDLNPENYSIDGTYTFHDEPQEFEKDKEYESACELENVEVCQTLEPIYSEPIKINQNAQQKIALASNAITETNFIVEDDGIAIGGVAPEESTRMNTFQRNKKLWEEISNTTNKTAAKRTSIYRRKHIAPDLVMDLPYSSKATKTNIAGETLDSKIKEYDETTIADQFARNQSTMKKNERYVVALHELENLDISEKSIDTHEMERLQPNLEKIKHPVEKVPEMLDKVRDIDTYEDDV